MTRKGTITAFQRAVLTALIAYALVLQTVLASFGGAAHAARALEPQGVLCLQEGRGPLHDPAKAHNGLCCTLSCHHAGAAGPAPEGAFAEPHAHATLVAQGPLALSVPRHFSRVLPVGSRAPPRLA